MKEANKQENQNRMEDRRSYETGNTKENGRKINKNEGENECYRGAM